MSLSAYWSFPCHQDQDYRIKKPWWWLNLFVRTEWESHLLGSSSRNISRNSWPDTVTVSSSCPSCSNVSQRTSPQKRNSPPSPSSSPTIPRLVVSKPSDRPRTMSASTSTGRTEISSSLVLTLSYTSGWAAIHENIWKALEKITITQYHFNQFWLDYYHHHLITTPNSSF